MTVQEAIKKHIAECRGRILRIKEFAKSSKRADVEGCEENVFVLKNVMESLEEVEQYRALGTVKELKEAREKQVAKEPISSLSFFKCPSCGSDDVEFFYDTGGSEKNKFCPTCGQAIDWEEGGTSD